MIETPGSRSSAVRSSGGGTDRVRSRRGLLGGRIALELLSNAIDGLGQKSHTRCGEASKESAARSARDGRFRRLEADGSGTEHRSEEPRVGKECRSRWSP